MDGLPAVRTLEGPGKAPKKGPWPDGTASAVRSGELERGEWRVTLGDWQPGVFRTRDRCSSRMACGSSSHWLPDGRRGSVKEALLMRSLLSSLSSSWAVGEEKPF